MTPSIQETVERLKEWAPKFAPEDSLSKDLKDAAALIERLAGALEEVDRQLTNAQPHIASIADRYGQDAIAYIDPHIDMAIEVARSALSGEPT